MLPQLRRFADRVVPQLIENIRGGRMIRDAAAIQATDRWNSFHRFPDTVATMLNRYQASGAEVHVDYLQTGGAAGSGRWIIHEAADVLGATLDVERPIRRRILDYRKNPWHVTQWSSATPPDGLAGTIAIVDNRKQLDELTGSSLRGQWLLTRLDPRPLLQQVAALGAVGIISDQPVPAHPEAVAWSKFGWGGLPVPAAAARLIGLGVSAVDGERLRRLRRKCHNLTLRAKVQVRYYVGHHQVVSGVIRGCEAPEKEILYIAHYAEPGALDNASGVAVGIAIAGAVNRLIREGRLRPPRRSIRFVHGYEAYGTLGFLEHFGSAEPPLASVNLDCVGAKPEVCDGYLDWSATTPVTGEFVNTVGEACLRRTLNETNPGYRLRLLPYMGGGDSAHADPMFGCPCPSLQTFRGRHGGFYAAYHSSADTIELLSERGLEACAAATAAFLYYLADAGAPQITELAEHETRAAIARMRRNRGPSFARYAYTLLQASLSTLSRWLFDSETQRKAWIKLVDGSPPPQPRVRRSNALVPVRKVPYIVMRENMAGHLWRQISESRLPLWTLYWADGSRDLQTIQELVSCDLGEHVSLQRIASYFQALDELGYVSLAKNEQKP